MPNHYLQRVRDMPTEIKHTVERVLGRSLRDDETVSVSAYPTPKAPAGEARAEAYRLLMERIEKTTARVKDLPEEELGALIDEAVRYAHEQRP